MGFSDRRPAGPAILAGMAILVSCTGNAPLVDTTLKFDGEVRTISTGDVTCTQIPDGPLIILVQDGAERSVRIVLHTRGRLVVERIGLRHHELAGFVADPAEVDAVKVDDTYTVSGRMPPNEGETQWHRFEIVTTCPRYDAPPRPTPRFRPPPLN